MFVSQFSLACLYSESAEGALLSSALKMTLGLTELLDLAISPQIGPVNFFHLRNLLHTIVEHFGIGEIKAQQAEIQRARSLGSSSSQATSSSDEDSQSENEQGWLSLYVQFHYVLIVMPISSDSLDYNFIIL